MFKIQNAYLENVGHFKIMWGNFGNFEQVYQEECSTRVRGGMINTRIWRTPEHVYVGNVGQVYGEECAHVYVGYRKIPSTARTAFSKLCLSYKQVRKLNHCSNNFGLVLDCCGNCR